MDLDVSAVLARFGLEPTGEPVLLTGGEDNRNLRVPTRRGDVVVREYRRTAAEQIRAELGLVDFLHRNGFPTPAPLRADNGEPLIEAGLPVAVFPFVLGDVPAELTEPLAEQCGALLARLHLLTADRADERIPVMDRPGVLRQALATQVDLDGADSWRAETTAFLETHRDELAELDRLPSGPLHHDLHRQNLLVERGTVTALLDFDELNLGPRVIDLARCLGYLALDRPDLALPLPLASACIDGYRSVRPLTDAELALLPLAFDLAGLVDAAGVIAWGAPAMGLTDVLECNSWRGYLTNRGVLRSELP